MKNPNNKCKVCGGETPLIDKYQGYRKTCSDECKAEDRSRVASISRRVRKLSGNSNWT